MILRVYCSVFLRSHDLVITPAHTPDQNLKIIVFRIQHTRVEG